jgi:hypothetical protein
MVFGPGFNHSGLFLFALQKKVCYNIRMHKHQFVEDYIEIIAGYRLPNGKNNHSIFTIAEPIVSLARYDMKIVPSLAEQSIGGQGYTDKQARLAADLIVKYERQLAKHGIDITPVRTPQYRLPLRSIDRSTRIWIDDDKIKVKFPYDVKMVETVRDAAKISKGTIKFNRTERLQEADLTEWNLNWLYAFAKANNFEIDDTVEDLMKLVLAVESRTYAIELCYSDDKIWLTNAEDSLSEYIVKNLGGFTADNVVRLIDWAPILGYSISKDIAETVTQEFGTRFWSLCANRQLKVDTQTSPDLIKDVAEYARATDRFPIFVFEPDLSGRLLTEFTKYFPDQIHNLSSNKDEPIDYSARVIYTNKIPRRPVDRIPLMVSSAGMLHGGDRQIWIQTAEKVVYFAKEVYNNSTKGTTVCKLD